MKMSRWRHYTIKVLCTIIIISNQKYDLIHLHKIVTTNVMICRRDLRYPISRHYQSYRLWCAYFLHQVKFFDKHDSPLSSSFLTGQNPIEFMSLICMPLMLIRLKFEPVVLGQSLFNLWKNVWTGHFEELANAFENLRNLFSRENFICLTPLIGSIIYLWVFRWRLNIFLIETFHVFSIIIS